MSPSDVLTRSPSCTGGESGAISQGGTGPLSCRRDNSVLAPARTRGLGAREPGTAAPSRLSSRGTPSGTLLAWKARRRPAGRVTQGCAVRHNFHDTTPSAVSTATSARYPSIRPSFALSKSTQIFLRSAAGLMALSTRSITLRCVSGAKTHSSREDPSSEEGN